MQPKPYFFGAVHWALLALTACQSTEQAQVAPSPSARAVRPNRVPEGTTVTIVGKNFSPVPTENQILFNGTAAVVSAATDSTLTTTVPAGVFNYATGPLVAKVEVQTQGRAALHAVELISDQAPEFIAVVPANAPAGTTVTIQGRHFNPDISHNLVIFSSLGFTGAVTPGTVLAATATTLQVRVPNLANTDELTVWTDPVTNEPVRYYNTFSFTVTP